MKTLKINLGNDIVMICGQLKRGQIKRFNECLLAGDYKNFEFELVKGAVSRYIKFANDKSSNHGNWYAHCNGYMFDSVVRKSADGKRYIQIDTWSGFRKESK